MSGQTNSPHYSYHGDAHATFSSFFRGSDHFDIFFGTDADGEDDLFNPFSRFTFSHVGGGPHGNEGLRRGRRRLQGLAVIQELLVTLEEVFHGCTKRMKITRRRLNPDGRSLRTEDKVLDVVVKKGWKAGTKITFPREGDETPNNTPADITFVLKDKKHSQYKRDGSNIVYTAKITLKEVGVCACVRITIQWMMSYLSASDFSQKANNADVMLRRKCSSLSGQNSTAEGTVCSLVSQSVCLPVLSPTLSDPHFHRSEGAHV